MMGMPNPNAYRSPLHAGAGPRLGAGIPGASGAPGFAPPGGGLYGNAPGKIDKMTCWFFLSFLSLPLL